MSDIFDHELDAYQQYDMEAFEDAPWGGGRGRTFHRDRLYYHDWFSPVVILQKTERQLLLTYENKTLWMPGSIIARIDGTRVLAHRNTFLTIFEDKEDLFAGFDEINKED